MNITLGNRSYPESLSCEQFVDFMCPELKALVKILSKLDIELNDGFDDRFTCEKHKMVLGISGCDGDDRYLSFDIENFHLSYFHDKESNKYVLKMRENR